MAEKYIFGNSHCQWENKKGIVLVFALERKRGAEGKSVISGRRRNLENKNFNRKQQYLESFTEKKKLPIKFYGKQKFLKTL